MSVRNQLQVEIHLEPIESVLLNNRFTVYMLCEVLSAIVFDYTEIIKIERTIRTF